MSEDYIVRPNGMSPRTALKLTDTHIIYDSGIIGQQRHEVPLANADVSISAGVKGYGTIIVSNYGQKQFEVGGIIKPGAFLDEFNSRKEALQNHNQKGQNYDAQDDGYSKSFKNSAGDSNHEGQTFQYKGKTYPYSDRAWIIEDAIEDIRKALADKKQEMDSDWARFVPPNIFWSTSFYPMRDITYQYNGSKEVHNTKELGFRLGSRYHAYSYYPEKSEYVYRMYRVTEPKSSVGKALNALGGLVGIYDLTAKKDDLKEDWTDTDFNYYVSQIKGKINSEIASRRADFKLRMAFYGAVAAAGIYLAATHDAKSAEVDTSLLHNPTTIAQMDLG